MTDHMTLRKEAFWNRQYHAKSILFLMLNGIQNLNRDLNLKEFTFGHS